MKLLTTGITLLALSVSLATHGEGFTARHAGQGFTAITKDFTSALSNPALLTKYQDDDDVYFSLNLGIMVADKDSVIDNGDLLADLLDDFETNFDQVYDIADSIESSAPEDVPAKVAQVTALQQGLSAKMTAITDTLKLIDDKPVLLREGLNVLIIVPNKHLSFGLFANQYGRIGVTIDYDESDGVLLQNTVDAFNDPENFDDTTDFDADNLLSTAGGLGYSVLEAGFMVGYPAIKSADYDLSVGAKVKFQRLDLFYNQIGVNDFDEDEFDITDDEHLTDSEGSNIDLGLNVLWGEQRQWSFGLVLNNLAKNEISLWQEDIQKEFSLAIEASATAGISYQQELFSISAEFDLTERESFQQLGAVQYASVGAELDLWQHAQLRAGIRTDLNDTEADVYTFGIGFSPWDVFAMDIAAFAGSDDNAGLALQFGLKI